MINESHKNRNFWMIAYIISATVLIIIHFLAKARVFQFLDDLVFSGLDALLQKWSITLAVISIILLIRVVLEKLIVNLDQAQGERYNLIRITRLIGTILSTYVILSSLFANPYDSLAGLGIASLILGFALQAPITSFISWLYIVFRRPYQVGDRIQINDHRGDVVEISYLDTIIEECSGDYLQNDRKSGRLIHFPNSKILTDRIINYSGPEIPFIWNETALQVAYTSDLEFVEECLIKATEKDFQNLYPKMYEPGNRWESKVYFRVNQRAWLEAVISYPVEPYDTTGKRNRILRTVLPLLNAAPEKVKFPEGTLR